MLRFIRFLILSLIVLFLVMTGLSLLFPSSTRVMRVITIAASRGKAMSTVSDLRTWPRWNGFVQSPDLTNKRWSTPSAGKNAWMRTDQLTVTETAADSNSIAVNWDLRGGKQYAGGFQIDQSFPDSVTVQWWFDLHFRWYPWEKLGVFVYDRRFGHVMEESLRGLKRDVENSR
jgi:hypothetical protein